MTDQELEREFYEWADKDDDPNANLPYGLRVWKAARREESSLRRAARDLLGIIGLFGLRPNALRDALRELRAAVYRQ